MKIKHIYLVILLFSTIIQSQHNAGSNCQSCHNEFAIAGTVFADTTGTMVKAGVTVTLTAQDGEQILLDKTDINGNFYSPVLSNGKYKMQVGDLRSKHWHSFPAQQSCNSCHIQGGLSNIERTKRMRFDHTELPADNNCQHCHHFPQTMELKQLVVPSVLHPNRKIGHQPFSHVRLVGQEYDYNPEEYDSSTVRPDIFAPGYYSMFDVILKVAEKQNIEITYEWDSLRSTHWITHVNGVEGKYWYHFAYDVGYQQDVELRFKRANRWDELLYRKGASVWLTEGEALHEIRAEYLEEIEREKQFGKIIPNITIALNPTYYNGNPPGSGRITITKQFENVEVRPFNHRSVGYPSPYSKPFQPGVVTAMDMLHSMVEDGDLTTVTNVFYTHFASLFIDSYYVVEIGFPDVGTAHASGYQGFVYIAENGNYWDTPNNADRRFHITSDIFVIHSPDFARWDWIELGRPHYEKFDPTSVDEETIHEDADALGRGFNLYSPYPNPFNGQVNISYNIFIEGDARITVYDQLGRKVEQLMNEYITNTGSKNIKWNPGNIASGIYYVVMEYRDKVQVRNIVYVK